MSVHCLSWVFRHSPVSSPTQRLVLLVLADHASHDGTNAYPAVPTIASEARLSTRAVQYALRALEDAGHVRHEGLGPHGTHRYTVAMGAQDVQGVGAQDVQGANGAGVHETDIGVHPGAPEPSLNRPDERPEGLSSSPEALRLADLLTRLTRSRTGAKRKYAVSKAGVAALEALHQTDGRSWVEIEAAIKWLHRDPFWSTVVLSPDKLRKHFDAMRLQASETRASVSGRPLGRTAREREDRTERYLRAIKGGMG